MANRPYEKACGKLGSGQINLATAPLKAILLSADHVPDTSATGHEFLADIMADRLGTDVALTSQTFSADGVLDADDPIWTAVPAGNPTPDVAALVSVYIDTGNPATSPLLGLYDQITSFPFTTNGGNIKVEWSNGPGRTLKIGALPV